MVNSKNMNKIFIICFWYFSIALALIFLKRCFISLFGGIIFAPFVVLRGICKSSPYLSPLFHLFISIQISVFLNIFNSIIKKLTCWTADGISWSFLWISIRVYYTNLLRCKNWKLWNVMWHFLLNFNNNNNYQREWNIIKVMKIPTL